MNKSVTQAFALAILVALAQVAAGQSAAGSGGAKRYELVPAPLRASTAVAAPRHVGLRPGQSWRDRIGGLLQRSRTQGMPIWVRIGPCGQGDQ